MTIHNLTVRTTRYVKADFSADQWGLFTHSFPRKEIERIATSLNSCLCDLADNNCIQPYTKDEAREVMHRKMKGYKEYGAYDSEPIHFLDSVLDEIWSK